MTDREYALKCESSYEKQLDKAADTICADERIKLILVAGPSCAGKTTTTKKLREKLTACGRTVYQVSLDDFYKNKEDAPIGADGKPDLETIESLDLEYLHEFLALLCEGREVLAPRFDFHTKRRAPEYEKIDMEEGDLCIIEGLHALNPIIYERYLDRSRLYRIFLDPQDNKKYGFTKYEIRRMRRLVRDFYNRNSSAENTLTMWHSVREGERKWIYPFESDADVTVDTCFEYEPAILKTKAEMILRTVSAHSEHWQKSKILLDKLAVIEPLSESIVPKDSMLREFI
ncbi:MAG TPA: nucleoside kinase [Bacillota bacterium]|nr:nucleoside kinase [Bacillota bacterium]